MRWPFISERRALTLFVLGFYTSLLIMLALGMGGAWRPSLIALAATYAIAFFGLASGWFWARWFTLGLGLSGLFIAGLGLVTQGWSGSLAIFGGIHLLVSLPICGDRMADLFENKEDWRTRLGIDESGVLRLRKSVISAASALPTLILYALAPRSGSYLAIFLIASLGLAGLLRMRFWGVALLGLSAAALGISALAPSTDVLQVVSGWSEFWSISPGWLAGFAFSGLGVSILPFLRPAWRFYRTHR